MSKADCIIGIDIGIKGAIACISNGVSTVHKIPTMEYKVGGKTRTKIDAEALSLLLKMITAGKTPVILIEQVASRPGQSVVSMFNFGRSLGVIEGICAGCGFSVMFVSPQKWKSYYPSMAGKDRPQQKDEARKLATQMWPELSANFKKKTDDGLAEALLIAHYAGHS